MMIQVGIVTDATNAWGEEIEQDEFSISDTEVIEGYLRRDILGAGNFEVKTTGNTFAELQGVEDLQLLIADYGGTEISSPIVARMEIRKFYNWAEANDNRLLILWTPYTGRAIDEVFESFGVDPVGEAAHKGWSQTKNIIVRGMAWDGENPDMVLAIRSWLGLSAEIPTPPDYSEEVPDELIEP